jgi:multiple sugar transport system substrate-binding protein
VSDWADAALDAVSYNGQIYGVPMDFHANLWHVNMEIMAEAGLVEDDGTPVLPTLARRAHRTCRQMVKAATGQDYLAADFAQFPIGVRLVLCADVAAGREHLHRGRHRHDQHEAAPTQ